jgi:23S rRNA (guanosine2251-2'-O)-methyltransferase
MSATVIIGKHAVKQLITSDAHIEKLYVRQRQTIKDEIRQIIALAKKNHIQLQWLEPATFDQRFVGDHQGIACITHAFRQGDIQDLILNQPSVIVMLDHIQDPHNFGAICRTSEAFGIHHMCYPKDRAVQITPSVVKASSGAAEAISFYRLTNLSQALTKLRAHGYWIYAASSNIGTPIHRVSFNFPMVLICGSEHNGISKGLTKHIHEFVTIPMTGQTSSLNVSVATGIILHTIASQNI